MNISIKNISLIVYDFDGVFTDNRVLVFEDGKEAVFCNRADGLAVEKIKKLGIPQIILSTEKNQVVKIRAKKLNIKVIHGIADKKAILVTYCRRRRYNLKKVVYIGNDVNDLRAMRLVGYPIAPQDANNKVKDIAKTIVQKKGGEGVVREFFENVLRI